ncbi:Uncharacterised protein [Chryseobacterium carnipullorum]|uniref:Uncharacterized protein n=1 Tax=Chryseobacterium carnipullorum TaxID=1124835 RepID=A0A376E6P9_CHRCU|nr:Uncharacterised protein [Chryseobacterium carnipullorum]
MSSDSENWDHLYQEVGLEWNNFLSTYFNLGLFYRVGYYTTPNFKQNFAIQFKLKVLEFLIIETSILSKKNEI